MIKTSRKLEKMLLPYKELSICYLYGIIFLDGSKYDDPI